MPNVTPDQGHWFYVRASQRYILREPAEMTGVFHYYLINPGAWKDEDVRSTNSDELPKDFQEFVHKLMKGPLESALARAQELQD